MLPKCLHILMAFCLCMCLMLVAGSNVPVPWLRQQQQRRPNINTEYPSRGGAAATAASTKNKAPSKVVGALSIPQRLLAGGSARALSQMVLYPIDALRTLAQTRDGRTLADVGISVLVRGCATTSSFALAVGAIQFAVYGACRNTVGPVVASAMGAAASCVASVPQEVIKQRLVAGIYPSFRIAVATIFKKEGVKGFYSSWRPTVARNVPFVVICFTAADVMIKQRIKARSNNDEGLDGQLSVNENLLIGVSSALVAGFITQPIDVIKTRMMTQAASLAIPYSNALDCARTILRTEGVATLWSGLVQRSFYMGPLWAMQFALNGKFSKAIQRNNAQLAGE